MNLKGLFTSLILLVFVFPAMAQPAITFKASHLKASEELLIATGVESEMIKIYSNMSNMFSANIPEASRPKFIEVMNSIMTKYLSWDAIKNDLANIYAEEFSEDELRQLTLFYLSPIGKKVSSRMATLQQKGMLIGQKRMQDNKVAIQAEMQKAFKSAEK
ncbi:MAG TPA: DUF2059 domain-containing protein [Sphingobacteriaceae bacterium]|nr:DUF2059 domain-containing protein [Sphingobacteriaceae bacterium]